MDAFEHHQHRQRRMVLVRPHNRRIRVGNLECALCAAKLDKREDDREAEMEGWRARDADVAAIQAARCGDPFAVLGPHQTPDGWVVRVFAPNAMAVRALTREGKILAQLPRRKDDFFEALIPSARERPTYRVDVETVHGTSSYIDSYA